MALPATGLTIRLYADISVYFGGPATNVRLNVLANTYLGVPLNTSTPMSSTFGGR
jgi:hypothetical protein